EAVERDRRLRVEVGDLTERVHAGVGAGGAGDAHGRLDHLLERGLEVLLHRRGVVLALPPRQLGAVVLEQELDVPQNSKLIPASQVVSPTLSRRSEPKPSTRAIVSSAKMLACSIPSWVRMLAAARGSRRSARRARP